MKHSVPESDLSGQVLDCELYSPELKIVLSPTKPLIDFWKRKDNYSQIHDSIQWSEMDDNRAVDCARLAEKYIEEERWVEASEVLRYGYSLDPNNVIVLTNLGGVLLMSQQLDEAEEMLRRSIGILGLPELLGEELDKKETKTLRMMLFKSHYNLAKVCHLRARKIMEENQGPLESEVKYRPWRDSTWDNVGDLIEEYTAYLKEAENSIEKAIELNQDFHKSWMVYGQVLDDLGKYSEAASAIDRAIELDNKCKECWFTKGYIQAHMGDYAAAEVAFRTVLEIDFDDTDAWWCLGATLQDLGKTIELIEVQRNLERLGSTHSTLPKKP